MEIAVIVKLLIVIAALLALVFLKQKPEVALAASSVLMILIYGKGLQGFADAFRIFFRDQSTVTLPITIILIGILSGVMGKTGMLQKMIDHMKPMVRSTKLTIILTPLLIGLLAVTGGAYVSCPLVDQLGDTLGISPERKAAINLVYRHSVHYSYPLSGSLIVVANLSGLDVNRICLMLVPVVIWTFIIGHFTMMRDIKDVVMPKEDRASYLSHVKYFLLNFSPILVSLLLTVVFDLSMLIALPVGIVLAVIVANAQEDTRPKEDLVSLLFKKVNYKMVLVIFAALFFKACISSVSEIAEAMTSLARAGLPPELMIVIIAVLTSFPTASVQTPAAIIIPIMAGFGASEMQMMLYTCLVVATGTFGYYFSPVHMCQILTIEYFKTDLARLLKEYRYYLPALAVGIFVWYAAMKAILL
ncbi:MAG: DUF401 family protein [Firmicutes bacterium]|nr:DUF401 family protein [Bacillota bacterium]MBR0441859.1 DUF401 family protein [Bacillota bacterium]MBR0522565.1 DUF401 family protein [Bacillota bacterium]